jgi:hypothetical protein
MKLKSVHKHIKKAPADRSASAAINAFTSNQSIIWL